MTLRPGPARKGGGLSSRSDKYYGYLGCPGESGEGYIILENAPSPFSRTMGEGPRPSLLFALFVYFDGESNGETGTSIRTGAKLREESEWT